MPRWIKIVTVVLAVVTVGLVAVLLWGRATLRANTRLFAATLEAAMERARPAFLEDQAIAAAHPAFARAGTSNDAGPTLNPRLGWLGESDEAKVARAAAAPGTPPFSLPGEISQKIPNEFWTAPAALWRDLDFGWMAGLGGFDHWDLEKGTAFGARGPDGLFKAPFPEFASLVPWAKLRLAKGLAEGRAAEAGAEVAQLARLLETTETLIGALVGVKLLEVEGQARAALAASGKPVPAAWRALDDASIQRIRRAVRASPTLFRFETPERVAAIGPKVVAGRCAAIQEAVGGAMMLRPYIGKTRAEAYERLERTLSEATDCRLTNARANWKKAAAQEPRWAEMVCGDVTGGGVTLACRALATLRHLPGAEEALGDLLLGLLDFGGANLPGYGDVGR